MNKLKEQKGESIMMALLLVLVASVVSAVILTASIQAARRPRNERAAQQSYLTVSSAAEMVRDSILAAEYKREVIEEYELDTETGDYVHSGSYVNTVQPTGLMAQWLAAGIGDDCDMPGCSDTIEINVPVDKDQSLDTVLADFVMDSDGGITVRFSIKDGGDDCRMTLSVKGKYEEDTNATGENERIVVTTQTVDWISAKITKGWKEADSGE